MIPKQLFSIFLGVVLKKRFSNLVFRCFCCCSANNQSHSHNPCFMPEQLDKWPTPHLDMLLGRLAMVFASGKPDPVAMACVAMSQNRRPFDLFDSVNSLNSMETLIGES
jgi:hypothetical protein